MWTALNWSLIGLLAQEGTVVNLQFNKRRGRGGIFDGFNTYYVLKRDQLNKKSSIKNCTFFPTSLRALQHYILVIINTEFSKHNCCMFCYHYCSCMLSEKSAIHEIFFTASLYLKIDNYSFNIQSLLLLTYRHYIHMFYRNFFQSYSNNFRTKTLQLYFLFL